MTDRELLELAAKAAEIKINLLDSAVIKGDLFGYELRNGEKIPWNPLSHNGDALKLAVKLGIELEFFANCIRASKSINGRYWEGNESLWVDDPDPYAATRRAIVRVAAEIGRTL